MFKRVVLQLAKPTFATRSTARNVSTFSSPAGTFRSHKQAVKLGLVLGTAFIGGVYVTKQASSPILLDAASRKGAIDPNAFVRLTDANGIELVQPPAKSPPFPVELFLPSSSPSDGADPVKYELLGVGVRTVSFLSIHVYALGIYIASADRQLAHDVLAGAPQLKVASSAGKDGNDAVGGGDLKSVLLDSELGPKIISHLLDHGIRLDVRIVPVRNTDFSHLRDGFVRQILAHPMFKQINTAARDSSSSSSGGGGSLEAESVVAKLGEGINDLKVVFSRKMSVPKHNVLHLIRSKEGALKVVYYKGKYETDEKVDTFDLGTVINPDVSKILFLQYLAGHTVSSESARQTTIEALTKL